MSYIGSYITCSLISVIIISYLYPICIGKYINLKIGGYIYIGVLIFTALFMGFPYFFNEKYIIILCSIGIIIGTSMSGSLCFCLSFGALFDPKSIPNPFNYNNFIKQLDNFPLIV